LVGALFVVVWCWHLQIVRTARWCCQKIFSDPFCFASLEKSKTDRQKRRVAFFGRPPLPPKRRHQHPWIIMFRFLLWTAVKHELQAPAGSCRAAVTKVAHIYWDVGNRNWLLKLFKASSLVGGNSSCFIIVHAFEHTKRHEPINPHVVRPECR
jgi:hypothetical protein